MGILFYSSKNDVIPPRPTRKRRPRCNYGYWTGIGLTAKGRPVGKVLIFTRCVSATRTKEGYFFLPAIRVGYAQCAQTYLSSTPTALVYELYGPTVVCAAALAAGVSRHSSRIRLTLVHPTSGVRCYSSPRFSRRSSSTHHIGPTHGPHNTWLFGRGQRIK